MQMESQNGNRLPPPYERRMRTPRFGMIILIIMAIISVVIALTVAYILT